MKIIVNPHRCIIDKTPVNEKEINVNKCEFEFSEEIPSGYVKEAYFTYNGITYKQIIFNNECDFPPEVLEKKGQVEIGVVVYETDNEQYIQRFNPSPAYFETLQGSLKDQFENSEEITPTDKEQLESAVAEGLNEINEALEDTQQAITEANNLDLDVSKEGKVATVTLTKKDGTQESVNLIDGEDGVNGITPTIGNNGNWYLGDTDTGKPSRGIQGEPGQNGTNGQDAKINGVNTLSIVAGENITLSQSGNELEISATGGSGGTSDYYDLTNKPSINNVTLVGNKSLSDLGIQPAGSYYTKPVTGIPKTDLSSEVQTSLGKADTAIQSSDLTNYVTNTDYATDTKGGLVKANTYYGLYAEPDGMLHGMTKTYADYGSYVHTAIISKGTLENVITGKQLVNKTYVDNLVGDIASAIDLINGEVI